MLWREHGGSPPSRPRAGAGLSLARAAIAVAIASRLVSGFWFTPVLPSVFGMQISLAAGALVALLVAWWSRPGGPMSGRAPARWVRNPWLRVPAFVLSFGLATYIGLAFGAVGLTAALVGHPTSPNAYRHRHCAGQPRQCAHFEVREAPALLSRALCAPQNALDQTTAGQILTVTGKGFALGMMPFRLGSSARRPRFLGSRRDSEDDPDLRGAHLS